MTITIHPTTANLFATSAHYLVDPVDCTGAQGAGLAKVFAARYPDECDWFRSLAKRGGVKVGEVYKSGTGSGLVLFLPTKRHWRERSSIGDVADGLRALADLLTAMRADSVAIPALGCGLGGLAWDDVRPLILATAERLSAHGVRVEVYPPHEERKGKRR